MMLEMSTISTSDHIVQVADDGRQEADHDGGDASNRQQERAKKVDSQLRTKKVLMELMVLLEEVDLDRMDLDWMVVLLYVVFSVIFIIIIIITLRVHAIHELVEHRMLYIRIHTWGLLLMLLFSFPLIRFVTYVVSEPLVWIQRMQVYTILLARGLKRSVDVTLWLTLLLCLWYTRFQPQIGKDTKGHAVKIVVKQIRPLLLALTVVSIIWTVKTALYLLLLAKMHLKDELGDRIPHAILDFIGLKDLERAQQFASLDQSESRSYDGDGSDDKQIATFRLTLHRLNKETVPVWILMRLKHKYMRQMRNNDAPEIFQNPEVLGNDDKLMAAAKNLLNPVVRGSTAGDLHHRGLKMFARKEDGTLDDREISRDELLRRVVSAVKNCWELQRNIENSSRIFSRLREIMGTFVAALGVIIWLLISQIVSTAQLAILVAPFVSLGFVFGDSLKTGFNGVLFVFAMRPFNIGDHVIIDAIEMKVEEMNILTTKFIKHETGVEEIYPNSELATKTIVNLRTNLERSDSIEFTLPKETPNDLVSDLQVKIKKTLDDDHETTCTPSTIVVREEISNVEVKLVVRYNFLHISGATRAIRRSKVLRSITKLCQGLENHIKTNKTIDDSSSLEEEHETLKLTINATNIKLSKIEKLKNKIILPILWKKDSKLKEISKVLYTGIVNSTITMDVQFRRAGLFTPDDKLELKDQIEKEMLMDGYPREILVQVSWHSNQDGDE